ncbi:hypothetical protein CRUP_002929 [Coryphaenoides rupestris]|nr:hypothetical protein CRUP_002929 [Coryphaenoides rupestris]
MRGEEPVAGKCFEYHGCLSHQQNLLQDYERTATYQRAFLVNEADFRDKVVLSVGGGSGILPFFAVQAGARRVYAVETSPMADYLKVLVQGNSLSDRITVLEGKLEEVNVPHMVDIIVSEPIGYMLLHERKLDSFLHARKWLKPNGRVSPRHVHPDDRYGTCPAIDYTRHTLDGAACLLNSNKYFPSRVSIKESSVAKLSSVCRRIYRIFSHAYFHHREIFDAYENETFLCHRFTRFVMKYYLMSKDNLIVPIMEEETQAEEEGPEEDVQD